MLYFHQTLSLKNLDFKPIIVKASKPGYAIATLMVLEFDANTQ